MGAEYGQQTLNQTNAMNWKAGLAMATMTLSLGPLTWAEEKEKRPEWDQEKAVAMVKALIAKEDRGEFDWDKIAWKTNAKEVVALAQKEQKPIFVYFFLKGEVGPKEAPC